MDKKSIEYYMPFIRKTLADFDFIKVHKYMVATGWKWYRDGERIFPTVGMLYQRAEELLIDAVKKQNSMCSVGFVATAYKHGVGLDFVIESAYNDDEEDDE